jgi:hypothetical protein
MYTENGLVIDLDQVRRVVREADVFAIAFRLFPERLLIDTRSNPDDDRCNTPMVAIVDPVGTVEERFFWLGQQRPSLGMPQNFNFFYWPHSVAYLAESGIWAAVSGRVVSDEIRGSSETCNAALDDLIGRERRANIDAIRGERHHTLWSAHPST